MITYKDAHAGLKGTVLVFLDGKRVGTIFSYPDKCYRYLPKGTRQTGEPFATLQACKQSLEAA